MSIQDRLTEEAHAIEDAGYFGKYFHMMLHMEDDELDPYQYRLLGRYRRVCGQSPNGKCWQNVRTLAKATRMSTGQVSETRRQLEEMGYIKCAVGSNGSIIVTLIDRMAENMVRYQSVREECSPHEQGVHDMNTSVHQVKQRKTLEEQPDKKERGAPSPRSLFASLSQVTPGTLKPRGAVERTSWALSDSELPDICKALWRVFGPLNSKLKVSAKQKEELEAAVSVPTNDDPYPSPAEMYSLYSTQFEAWLRKLPDFMKSKGIVVNTGNILRLVRGYHYKGIGWLAHMPQSARVAVEEAPANEGGSLLDAFKELIGE